MTMPKHIRVLAGAIAMATIAGCGLSLTATLLSVRLDAAGYSARAIGLNAAAGGVAALLIAPATPWIARRIGVAWLLFLALGAGGFALLGFTATRSYESWLALRFAFGIGVTIMFVLSEFWIGAASAHGQRGLAIGLYATSLGTGFAVGPLVLAAIGTAGDLPFCVGAGLFWAALIPLAMNTRDAPRLETRAGKPFWVFLWNAPAATMAGMLHGAIEVASIGLLPIYATRAGATIEQGAIFASLFIIGNSALQIPIGLLSDTMDRRLLLALIAGFGMLGALFLAGAGLWSVPLFEIVLVVWGAAVGGLYPVGLAQLGARFKGAELAGANAAFVMTYSIGLLTGPMIVGTGLDLMPPSGFFIAIGAMLGLYLVLICGGFLARLPPKPDIRQDDCLTEGSDGFPEGPRSLS